MTNEQKKKTMKIHLGILVAKTILACLIIGSLVLIVLSVFDVVNMLELSITFLMTATSSFMTLLALTQAINSSKETAELQKKMIELQKELIELQKSKNEIQQVDNDNT